MYNEMTITNIKRMFFVTIVQNDIESISTSPLTKLEAIRHQKS